MSSDSFKQIVIFSFLSDFFQETRESLLKKIGQFFNSVQRFSFRLLLSQIEL